MLYFVRCRLVPATLSGEFIALYPEDKPKASAIVYVDDIKNIEKIPANKGVPESIFGDVPVKMKDGFATFLDERGLRFTPRKKDVSRVREENGEVRDRFVPTTTVKGRGSSDDSSE